MSGKEVKAIRDRLKLRRDELAKRCGVNVRTVDGWEGPSKDKRPSKTAAILLRSL